MLTRTKYISITEAAAGMRLARSVSLASHGRLTLKLSQGHTLTPQCIEQLQVHGADCILILEDDPRTPEQRTREVEAAIQRARRVFANADLGEPTLAALYQQIMSYRSKA